MPQFPLSSGSKAFCFRRQSELEQTSWLLDGSIQSDVFRSFGSIDGKDSSRFEVACINALLVGEDTNSCHSLRDGEGKDHPVMLPMVLEG